MTEDQLKRVRCAGKNVLDVAPTLADAVVARELARIACLIDKKAALNECERRVYTCKLKDI